MPGPISRTCWWTRETWTESLPSTTALSICGPPPSLFLCGWRTSSPSTGTRTRRTPLYDRLVSETPDDDSVFEARGQHLLRQGAAAPALTDFQKALALKPQNPRLQRPRPLGEAAGGVRDSVPPRRGRLREGRAAKSPNRDDETETLAEVNVIRVYPNGLSSRVHQAVVKVFTEAGVDRERGAGRALHAGRSRK